MAEQIEKLAVLFADICDSTALYDNLGDDLARKLTSHCINTMLDKISAYRGTLVKTIGDEIMVTFPNAESALLAACEMKTAVENDRPSTEGPVLQVRIGFNYGEVIRESNDVFGNTVNVAARVVSITRAGQIMTTQAVYDALPQVLTEKLRQIMRAEFKGKQEQQQIYQVVCEQEDTMSTRYAMPAFRRAIEKSEEMELRYRGQSIRINRAHKSVAAGRAEACDIVVRNAFASRLHVHIELRFGKFIIADQSTNGTYIRFSNGNVVHITREEIPLHGAGVISLGQSFADDPVELIEFTVTPD